MGAGGKRGRGSAHLGRAAPVAGPAGCPAPPTLWASLYGRKIEHPVPLTPCRAQNGFEAGTHLLTFGGGWEGRAITPSPCGGRSGPICDRIRSRHAMERSAARGAPPREQTLDREHYIPCPREGALRRVRSAMPPNDPGICFSKFDSAGLKRVPHSAPMAPGTSGYQICAVGGQWRHMPHLGPSSKASRGVLQFPWRLARVPDGAVYGAIAVSRRRQRLKRCA